MTFVEDDYLSEIGAFGVDPGDRFKIECGAYLKGREMCIRDRCRFDPKIHVVIEGAEFADYFWPAVEQYVECTPEYWRSNGKFVRCVYETAILLSEK